MDNLKSLENIVKIVKGNTTKVLWSLYKTMDGTKMPCDVSEYEDIAVDIVMQYQRYSVRPTVVDLSKVEFYIDAAKQRFGPVLLAVRWGNQARSVLRGKIVFVEDSRFGGLDGTTEPIEVSINSEVGDLSGDPRSYESLTDKPGIGGVILHYNTTLEDLGLDKKHSYQITDGEHEGNVVVPTEELVQIPLPKIIRGIIIGDEGTRLPFIGTTNLVKNSDFRGTTGSLLLEEGTEIYESLDMTGKLVEGWKLVNCELVEEESSITGNAIFINDGSLSQIVAIPDKTKVHSVRLRYKGELQVTAKKNVTLSSEDWSEIFFVVGVLDEDLNVLVQGTGYVAEISVVQGSIEKGWMPSLKDIHQREDLLRSLFPLVGAFEESGLIDLKLNRVIQGSELTGIGGDSEVFLYAGMTKSNAKELLKDSQIKGWAPLGEQSEWRGFVCGQDGRVIFTGMHVVGPAKLIVDWPTSEEASVKEVYLEGGYLKVKSDSTDFPENPNVGEMFFDKVNKKPYWFDGSNWLTIKETEIKS